MSWAGDNYLEPPTKIGCAIELVLIRRLLIGLYGYLPFALAQLCEKI